jgi:hypothetical protein
VEDKDIRMLVQAIGDYGQRVKSLDEHGRSRHKIRYNQVLMEFLIFAISNNIAWKDMFTFNTLQDFAKNSRFKGASRILKKFQRQSPLFQISMNTTCATRNMAARFARVISARHEGYWLCCTAISKNKAFLFQT